ncbi:MAG: MFS transporter [Methanophagales archaeon]|nr:MFS transporter [Methanophagales archaeon]
MISLTLNSRLHLISVGVFIQSCGWMMVSVFFPLYLLKLEVSVVVIGFSATLAVVGRIVCLPLGGVCSDLIGRKRTMVLALGMQTPILAAMGFFRSATFLILLWVLVSACWGLLLPAQDVMIADIVKAKERVKAYGLLHACRNVGFGIGSLFGGFLAAVSYPNLFFAATLSNGAFFAIVWHRLDETKPNSGQSRISGLSVSLKGYKSVTKDAPFLVFCLLAMLTLFIYTQVGTPFTIYSVRSLGITEPQLGSLRSLNCWIVALLQYPVAWGVGKRNLKWALFASLLLFGVGYQVVSFSSSFQLLIVFMVILTLGELFESPSLTAGAMRFAPESKRGAYMGLSSTFQSIGWAIAPSVGCSMLEVFNPSILWNTVTFLSVLTAFAFLKVRIPK